MFRIFTYTARHGSKLVTTSTKSLADDAAKKAGDELSKKTVDKLAKNAANPTLTKTGNEIVTEKVTEHPQLGTLYGPYIRSTPAQSASNQSEVIAFQPEFKKTDLGTDIIGKFFDFLTPTEAKSSSQVFYSTKPHSESLMDTPAGSTVKWRANQNQSTNHKFHNAVSVEEGKAHIHDTYLVQDIRDRISSGIPRLPQSLHSIYSETLDSLLPRKPR